MGPVTGIVGHSRRFTHLLFKKLWFRKNTEVCLVLYKCFVKETVPINGGLADFSTTSLSNMHANMHTHHCSLRSIALQKQRPIVQPRLNMYTQLY